MIRATLVQLYPAELGVAGDRGNVLALRARLGAAGIESDLIEHQRGDALPESADLVIVGNGPLSAMRNVHADLVANAETLRAWAADGVPFFAYGSGAELLGSAITLIDGSVIDGIGLLPFTTSRVKARKVGYVAAETQWGPVVGFEDNASDWHLDESASPLGRVTVGGGNGDGREGVLSGALIGTQIGGPVLPLNPALARGVVQNIALRHGVEIGETAVDDLDLYADKARSVIMANAAHVFSRI